MSTRDAGFGVLLERLGFTPAAAVTICHRAPSDGVFRTTWATADKAPEVADGYADGQDVWFNANGLWFRNAGRGRTEDVTRLSCLYSDLDVKRGGMPTMGAAVAVIDTLATMLGTQPVAVVMSGHGLQPYWAVDREDPAAQLTEENRPDAIALVRRFGRLVAHVAETHGGHADSVFDLARVLRVPGTWNRKGDPVPVTMDLKAGHPLTITEVDEQLTAYNVPEAPGDRDAHGEPVAPEGAWTWADVSHPAVALAVASWGHQTPRARHPWLLGAATSLTFAHRLGIITENDYRHAVQVLRRRFTWALTNVQPHRTAAAGEVAGCFAKAVTVAETKSEADARRDWAYWYDRAGAEDTSTASPEPDADRIAKFWAARPSLTHLHEFARARRAAPWAVLGVAMARVVVATPPHVVLPALVGSDASLNVFVAVVGASGDGKGAAVGAATDALRIGTPVTSFPVGSGEGLTHLFVARNKGEVKQHTTAVLAHVGEVDTLTALNSRQGSTLQPVLRQAYMGEEFGFGYADPTKRLVVGAHSYRLALVVGVQPKRAGALLDDTDGGTPQRFMWLPATDRDAPDTAPAEPKALPWKMPTLPAHDPLTGRVLVPVCETARVAVDDARLDRIRGNCDALDGHALLARLKVAAALGLLDRRVAVSDEDWELAETVMAISDATRGRIVVEVDKGHRNRNHARGIAEADRAEVVTARAEGDATKRIATRVHRKIREAGTAGLAGGELRRTVASRDRHLLDDALNELTDAGRVVVEDLTPDETGAGGVGHRYRVSGAFR